MLFNNGGQYFGEICNGVDKLQFDWMKWVDIDMYMHIHSNVFTFTDTFHVSSKCGWFEIYIKMHKTSVHVALLVNYQIK